MGKIGKSIEKGFKSVTKAAISKPLKQLSKEASRVPKNVGTLIHGVIGGPEFGGTLGVQQASDEFNQRYASEEGKETEQGATDLKTRLGVGDRKKIKRLSTVNKK